MSKQIPKGGCGLESNWKTTTRVFGGPGQQSFIPEKGNLIATHGGKRNHKRSRLRMGGNSLKKGGKTRRSSRKSLKRRKSKRGGCGCSGGSDTQPPVVTNSLTGGSPEPSQGVSTLLSGSVSS